ncbi:MAG: manganese efflux pump MntP family protein [Spirochaetota bacterium]
MLTWILVALSLAADAFAVSVSNGMCIPKLKLRYALRAALFFGLFQFGMPLLGWLLGGTFQAFIAGFDHWIAFGLLALIGGKMIRDSFGIKDSSVCLDEEDAAQKTILNLRTLFLLSIATSIDALAVGLSYRMAGEPILLPALIIGIITFALSFVGTEFGKRIGSRLERWAEFGGGLVLVGIGVKMLVDHLA